MSADILGRLEQRKNSGNGGAVKLKHGAAAVWICDAALRPEAAGGTEGGGRRSLSLLPLRFYLRRMD